MKVKAKKLGYYGNKRRREDQVFHIKSEKDFSEVWMKKLDSESSSPAKKKKKAPSKAKASEEKAEVDLNEEVI